MACLPTLPTLPTNPALRRLWEDLPPEEAAAAKAAVGPPRPGFNLNADGSRVPLGPEIEFKIIDFGQVCRQRAGAQMRGQKAAAGRAAARWRCPCSVAPGLGGAPPVTPAHPPPLHRSLAKFSSKTAAAAAGPEAQVRSAVDLSVCFVAGLPGGNCARPECG